MSLIEFNDVSFAYPNGFVAVENVSLSIESGENVAIVGQNGAGKTTTVKMINGLLKPTSGSVIVQGVNTHDETTAQLSRRAGYVFQNPDDQIFHNTVEEEIAFGPKVLGFDEKKSKEIVKYAIELTGLEADVDKNPYDLPLSVRKFVTIAAVIAMDVDIFIFDEPTAGQDLRGIKILEDLVRELHDKGKTVITITHDMEYVANNYDRVIVMAHKNVLKSDTPARVFRDSELLAEAMLVPPYICSLAMDLGIEEELLTQDDLIDYLLRSGEVKPS